MNRAMDVLIILAVIVSAAGLAIDRNPTRAIRAAERFCAWRKRMHDKQFAYVAGAIGARGPLYHFEPRVWFTVHGTQPTKSSWRLAKTSSWRHGPGAVNMVPPLMDLRECATAIAREAAEMGLPVREQFLHGYSDALRADTLKEEPVPAAGGGTGGGSMEEIERRQSEARALNQVYAKMLDDVATTKVDFKSEARLPDNPILDQLIAEGYTADGLTVDQAIAELGKAVTDAAQTPASDNSSPSVFETDSPGAAPGAGAMLPPLEFFTEFNGKFYGKGQKDELSRDREAYYAEHPEERDRFEQELQRMVESVRAPLDGTNIYPEFNGGKFSVPLGAYSIGESIGFRGHYNNRESMFPLGPVPVLRKREFQPFVEVAPGCAVSFVADNALPEVDTVDLAIKPAIETWEWEGGSCVPS